MIHVSNSDTPLEGGKMSCSCFLFPGDPMRLKLQMVYAQRHGYDSWWIGGEGVDMIVSNRGRWEFDIWKISPPTKGVWLKEVSTPKIWVKRCVCVVFFQTLEKNKGDRWWKIATHFSWPDWWDVFVFGLPATEGPNLPPYGGANPQKSVGDGPTSKDL